MSSEYNTFAQDFSLTRARPWPEFEILFPFIKKRDRVLDLGCGNGRLRKFLDPELVPLGNYYGLDVSSELLKIARENHPSDHFFLSNFEKDLPFGADQFEIIAAVASFHHLLNTKDQKHFFTQCHRVLKSGGKLFITTWILPGRYFWPNILRGRWKNWIVPFGKDRHPRTYRRVSLKALRGMGQGAGFKVVEEKVFEGRNNVVVFEKV
ncbi:MAG TPA: class I SAM-dependent methyltransferase [Candidatus Gracilibacteria bacterium]